MLLIWEGLGIAAVVIPIGLLFLVVLVVAMVVGSENAAVWTTAAAGLALFLSGLILHRIATRLAARQSRVLLDKETGQEVVLREKHTLFFVPLKYWAYLYDSLGVVVFLGGLLQVAGIVKR